MWMEEEATTADINSRSEPARLYSSVAIRDGRFRAGKDLRRDERENRKKRAPHGGSLLDASDRARRRSSERRP